MAAPALPALRLKDISIKTNQSFSSGSNVHEMGTSQINWTHPLWYQNVYLKYDLVNHFFNKWFFEINYLFYLLTIAKKTTKIVSYLLKILGETFRHMELLNWFLNWLIEYLETLVRPEIKGKTDKIHKILQERWNFYPNNADWFQSRV